jgi:isoamylase
MTIDSANWTLERGLPQPFGATITSNGINFAVASKYATSVALNLYTVDDHQHIKTIPLDPHYHRTGDVWHIHLRGATAPLAYGYQCDGPKERRHCFDPNVVLLDPYALAISPSAAWGESLHRPLGVVLPQYDFDWEGDLPLKHPLHELIIYETHVRAFTQDTSSKVASPGTYEGFCEKISHLVDLGITAVELLPIYTFDPTDAAFKNPLNDQPLLNLWGYGPLSFFTPMSGYASQHTVEAPLLEFKKLVKELHRAGIEVILDVVYNHTGEGSSNESTVSLRGIDHASYYHLDAVGHALDFSGCGNSLNANSPLTSELIIQSLRYWVTEMHVDGFRFDLASILNRGLYGRPLTTSPFIEQLSQDPVLAHTKFIAEPWDATGMYQVGAFYPQKNRWCEWNGKYRDTMRRFINGQECSHSKFATRLCGSQDLYGHFRKPTSSINFIVAHDGFTLHDLVSYTHKYNAANGEDNRDGTNDNYSWNCGAEGPTDDETILKLRQQQMRNFTVALFVSLGIPMFLMGDEYGHTKAGNNNSYNQDNALNWFLWNNLNSNGDFYRFFRGMISLRKKHSKLLQRPNFLTTTDIIWHNAKALELDWNNPQRFIAYTLLDPEESHHLYIAFNTSPDDLEITLPKAPNNRCWVLLVDTSLPPPHDYNEEAEAIVCQNEKYLMPAYSSIILKAS